MMLTINIKLDNKEMKHRILLGTIIVLLAFSFACKDSKNDKKYRTPTITSEWKQIVYYPNNHLNDFCIFQDREKVWHAMGIMGTGSAWSEVSLFHSTSNNLLTPFVNQNPILTEVPADTNLSIRKHAPHVIWHDGYYHLFYRRPGGTIVKTKSKDPNEWIGLGEDVFEENDARDICVINMDGMFYMYYCQYINYEGTNRSSILLRKSTDLEKWSEAIITYVDLEYEDNHSKLESPYVVKEEEGYYMFIRHRHLNERTTTVVLFSEDPEKFPSGIQTWFHELDYIHAPEIVKDKNKYYIVRVSGAQHANKSAPEKEGWLDIAEFEFR